MAIFNSYFDITRGYKQRLQGLVDFTQPKNDRCWDHSHQRMFTKTWAKKQSEIDLGLFDDVELLFRV